MKTCSILIALALLGSSSVYAFDKMAKEQSAKEKEGKNVQKTIENDEPLISTSNHPKITFKGHIDTGVFRDDSEKAQATLGDSRVIVSAELADRFKATIRTRLAHLDFYDELGRRKNIEEIVDIATLEINVDPNREIALVVGKLIVSGAVNKDAGLFYHKNKIRSHTVRSGYMGVMLKLQGESLNVLQGLVDEVEASVFETKNGDFKFDDKVGGTIRITRNLTDSTKLKLSQLILSSEVKKQVCNQDDFDNANISNVADCLFSVFGGLGGDEPVDVSSLTTAEKNREYVTSLGVTNNGEIFGRKTFSWVEGVVVKNYVDSHGHVEDTIGATAGADVKVYESIYTTVEGTILNDIISEGVASVRYQLDNGITVGTEARLRKYHDHAHETDKRDVFVGGMIRYDFR